MIRILAAGLVALLGLSDAACAGITVFEARGTITRLHGMESLFDGAPFTVGDPFIVTYAFHDDAPDLFPADPRNGLRDAPASPGFVLLTAMRVRIGTLDQSVPVTNSSIGIYQDKTIVAPFIWDEYHVTGALDSSAYASPFNGFRLRNTSLVARGESTDPGAPPLMLSQGDSLFTDPSAINLSAANDVRQMQAQFHRSHPSSTTLIVTASFDSLSLAALGDLSGQTQDDPIPAPAALGLLAAGAASLRRRQSRASSSR